MLRQREQRPVELELELRRGPITLPSTGIGADATTYPEDAHNALCEFWHILFQG